MRYFARPSILTLFLLPACIAKIKPTKPANDQSRLAASADLQIKDDAFSGSSGLPEALQTSMASLPAIPDDEIIWAMSQCRCMPAAKAEMLKSTAVATGVMTQFLVPRVRETIRANEQLQGLLKVPGVLGDVLKNALANDQALAKQVRASLSEKIARVVNAEIKDDIDFRFDHYLTRGLEENFAIRDMTARWNLVLSLGAFWRNEEPMAFGHHGLQVLETARALSEWKYLFGLDKDSQGGFYGGLTFETAEPLGQKLQRLDPREEPEARRTLSGTYKLSIPDDTSAVDLVMKAKELWTRNPEAPRIIEQAMMWNAGAYAFTRLRLDRRVEHTKALYGDSDADLLPTESHLLPLIFMSGVQGLLQDKFLDKDKREIKNLVDPGEVVDLRTLSRLGRALFSWISVLTDLDKAGLSAAQLEKLGTVPDRFKDALRLVQLAMLKDDHLFQDEGQSIASLAEGISLIVDTEQNLLSSELMQGKALLAFRQLVVRRVLPAWEGRSGETLTPQDVIWLYTAGSAIARYPQEQGGEGPWLKEFVAKLETALGPREDFPWRE